MRRAVSLGALVLAVFAAGPGDAAPVAVETRSCAQAGSFFNVHLSGHKLGGYWLRLHAETFAPVPAGEPLVAVWSFGSQATREPVLYAWSTAAKSDVRARCRLLRSARAPAIRGLRPAFRVERGWSLSRRFECNLRGRIVIRTRPIAGGARLTVWMEKSRQTVAVAEIVGRAAWVRASERCLPRDT